MSGVATGCQYVRGSHRLFVFGSHRLSVFQWQMQVVSMSGIATGCLSVCKG